VIGAALLLASGLLAANGPAAPAPVWTFELGDRLPAVELRSLDGATVRLPPSGGGPVVISVFAVWCAPCRMEMPELERDVWQVYRDRGLQFWAVDRQEPAELVGRYMHERGFTYPILLDPDRKFFDAIAADRKGIPKTLLLDGEGKVVWRSNGFFPGETIPALRAEIEKLLGPTAP